MIPHHIAPGHGREAVSDEPAPPARGSVVAFPADRIRPVSRATKAPDASGGEILLFTGVRYERVEHDAEKWEPVSRKDHAQSIR